MSLFCLYLLNKVFLIHVYHSFQNLIIRVPIHEIAAVCYVNDDGIHILAVKYGKANCLDHNI